MNFTDAARGGGDGFLPPDQVEGRLRRNDGVFSVILANAGIHVFASPSRTRGSMPLPVSSSRTRGSMTLRVTICA